LAPPRGALVFLPSFSQDAAEVRESARRFGITDPCCGWCALTAAKLLAGLPPVVTVPDLLASLRAALAPGAFLPALSAAFHSTRVFRDDFLARHHDCFSHDAECAFDRPTRFSSGMMAVFELSDAFRSEVPPGAAYFRARYVDAQFPVESVARWKRMYGSSRADTAVYEEEQRLGAPAALHPPPPLRAFGFPNDFNFRFAEGYLDLPGGSGMLRHPQVVRVPGVPGVSRAGALLPLASLLEGKPPPSTDVPRAFVVDVIGHFVTMVCVKVVAGGGSSGGGGGGGGGSSGSGVPAHAKEDAFARAGAYLQQLAGAAGGAPVPVTLILDSLGGANLRYAANKLAPAPALHAAAHGVRGGRVPVFLASEQKCSEQKWACVQCTLKNEMSAAACSVCGAPRGRATATHAELPEEVINAAALSARLFAGTKALYEDSEPAVTSPSCSVVMERTSLRGALLHANFVGAAEFAAARAAGGGARLLIVQCSDDHVGAIASADTKRVRVIELPLRDVSHPPQLETADPGAPLNRALADMETARAEGWDVLVNCKVGVSRSTSVLLAHLMEGSEGLSLRAAWDVDHAARPIACPNPGFVAQLMRREVRLRGAPSTVIPRALADHPVFVYTFDSEREGVRYYELAGGF
jgi:predicted protein tyrosine phosphatase